MKDVNFSAEQILICCREYYCVSNCSCTASKAGLLILMKACFWRTRHKKTGV